MNHVIASVQTLDELYGLLHVSTCFDEYAGGQWHNENFYPKSEEAEDGEVLAEHDGKLATEIPICPFWELVRDGALLVGIEPATLPQAKVFCGKQYPNHQLPGSMTANGPRPEAYAACYGIAVYLHQQLLLTEAEAPTEEELAGAHKLPAEDRNAVFRKKDLADAGALIRAELVSRVEALIGSKVDEEAAIQKAQEFLEGFVSKTLGSSQTSFYYHFAKDGCPSSPEESVRPKSGK